VVAEEPGDAVGTGLWVGRGVGLAVRVACGVAVGVTIRGAAADLAGLTVIFVDPPTTRTNGLPALGARRFSLGFAAGDGTGVVVAVCRGVGAGTGVAGAGV
jgi:hypothetical protein